MTDLQPEAPALEQELTEAVDMFREDLLYTAPEFHGERWGQFRERLRDIAADAPPVAAAFDPLTFRDVLRGHYLADIICDHEAGTDNPVCACSTVFLGWHGSVGLAVEAWVDHVLAEAARTLPAGTVSDDTGQVLASLHDGSRARAEAAEAELAAFEAHRPAILDALGMAAADTVYSSRAGRFTAALEALECGGDEDGHG